MQFSASASSHMRTQANKDRTQTYRRRPTARSHWFTLTQRLTNQSPSHHLAHHRQHAGSSFSRSQPHFDHALWHWDKVVWHGSPTVAAARCAWVDEVLLTRLSGGLSPEFCWFSFNTDASDTTSPACPRSASLIRVINAHTLSAQCVM